MRHTLSKALEVLRAIVWDSPKRVNGQKTTSLTHKKRANHVAREWGCDGPSGWDHYIIPFAPLCNTNQTLPYTPIHIHRQTRPTSDRHADKTHLFFLFIHRHTHFILYILYILHSKVSTDYV